MVRSEPRSPTVHTPTFIGITQEDLPCLGRLLPLPSEWSRGLSTGRKAASRWAVHGQPMSVRPAHRHSRHVWVAGSVNNAFHRRFQSGVRWLCSHSIPSRSAADPTDNGGHRVPPQRPADLHARCPYQGRYSGTHIGSAHLQPAGPLHAHLHRASEATASTSVSSWAAAIRRAHVCERRRRARGC